MFTCTCKDQKKPRYLFNTKHILIVKLKLSYFQINDEFYYSSSISDTFSRTCDSSIGQMLTTIRLDITPSTTRTFQKIWLSAVTEHSRKINSPRPWSMVRAFICCSIGEAKLSTQDSCIILAPIVITNCSCNSIVNDLYSPIVLLTTN